MYKKVFNKPENTSTRRKLRREMVKGEAIVWQRLRGKQINYKFRRQHGVGPFVVDFFCPSLKLVIEIDGLSHEDDQRFTYDRRRQQYLESKGITVIRFTSMEVFDDLDRVVEVIVLKCEDLSEKAPTQPPPCKGRDVNITPPQYIQPLHL